MAINKKLIHFNNFSTFNSQKLSANANNNQYTEGVNGEIKSGDPDILYQSICWIKDTKQQWTHGQLYSLSDTDNTYVADFTMSDIRDGIENQCQIYCDVEALIDAMQNHKIIIVKYDSSDDFGSYTLQGYVEDLIYFSIIDANGFIYICDTPIHDLYLDGRYIQKMSLTDFYNKPSSGIPISDMSAPVQGILNNAAIVHKAGVMDVITIDGIQTDSGGVYALPGQVNKGATDVLLSGKTIKTINNKSLAGSGNINVCENPDWNAASGTSSYIAGKTHHVKDIFVMAQPGQRLSVLDTDGVGKEGFRIFFEGDFYKFPEKIDDILYIPNETDWKIKVLYLQKSSSGTTTIYTLQHIGVNADKVADIADPNLYVVKEKNVKRLDPYYLSDSYVSKSGDSISGPITLDGLDRNINGCMNFSPTNSIVIKSLDIHNPLIFRMIRDNQEIIGKKIGPLTNIVYDTALYEAYNTGLVCVVTCTYENESILRTFRLGNASDSVIDLLTNTLTNISEAAESEEIKRFAGGLTVEQWGTSEPGYINIINNSGIDSVKLEIRSSDTNTNTTITSFEIYDQLFTIDFNDLDSGWSCMLGHPFLPLGFTQLTVNHLAAESCDATWDSKFIAKQFTQRLQQYINNRPVNGKTSGLFSISPGSEFVDIQGTITTAKNLEKAPVITTVDNTLNISIGDQTASTNMPWGDDSSRIYYQGETCPTTLTAFGDATLIGDFVAEYGSFEGVVGPTIRYLQFSKPVTTIPDNAFTYCQSIWLPPTVSSISTSAFTVALSFIDASHYIGDIAWMTGNVKLSNSVILCGNPAVGSYGYSWFNAKPYAISALGFPNSTHPRKHDAYAERTSALRAPQRFSLIGISYYTVRYTSAISDTIYVYPPTTGSIIFTTASTAPTISYVGSAIKWAGGTIPQIQANKTYEMSFNHGFGVCVEYNNE